MSAKSSVTCAAPGCENLVIRHAGALGRPPIYCSGTCRPTPSARVAQGILVEVDQDEPSAAGTGAGRSWVVRLRRGQQSVVVGSGLGRFSATAFSGELHQLLKPRTRQGGDTIE